jgi:hypothetical protein
MGFVVFLERYTETFPLRGPSAVKVSGTHVPDIANGDMTSPRLRQRGRETLAERAETCGHDLGGVRTPSPSRARSKHITRSFFFYPTKISMVIYNEMRFYIRITIIALLVYIKPRHDDMLNDFSIR